MREQLRHEQSCKVGKHSVVSYTNKITGKVTVQPFKTLHGVVTDLDPIMTFNLVVNGGRDNMARLLGGDSTLSIAYLALGTSKNNTPNLTDITLEDELKRIIYNQAADKTYPSVGSVKFSRTVLGDEFASAAVIREGGMVLSDGTAAVNTGTIFNRVIFVDDNPSLGLTNAGLVFQPTNVSGVALNNRIDFEILF